MSWRQNLVVFGVLVLSWKYFDFIWLSVVIQLMLLLPYVLLIREFYSSVCCACCQYLSCKAVLSASMARSRRISGKQTVRELLMVDDHGCEANVFHSTDDLLYELQLVYVVFVSISVRVRRLCRRGSDRYMHTQCGSEVISNCVSGPIVTDCKTSKRKVVFL